MKMVTTEPWILAYINQTKNLKEQKLKSFKELKKILELSIELLEEEIVTPQDQMKNV